MSDDSCRCGCGSPETAVAGYGLEGDDGLALKRHHGGARGPGEGSVIHQRTCGGCGRNYTSGLFVQLLRGQDDAPAPCTGVWPVRPGVLPRPVLRPCTCVQICNSSPPEAPPRAETCPHGRPRSGAVEVRPSIAMRGASGLPYHTHTYTDTCHIHAPPAHPALTTTLYDTIHTHAEMAREGARSLVDTRAVSRGGPWLQISDFRFQIPD